MVGRITVLFCIFLVSCRKPPAEPPAEPPVEAPAVAKPQVEAAVSSDTGAVSGRISPADVAVRIVAKTAGTEYKVKGNIKGEITLTQGGNFTISNLPAGKYDLLFLLQGESQKKYFATRWSEVVVQGGKATSGINYRLTTVGSEQLIDEVLVGFKKGTTTEQARKMIQSAGCVIKDTPLDLGNVIYTVDIPDDKSVKEMVEWFTGKEGVAYAEPNGITTVD